MNGPKRARLSSNVRTEPPEENNSPSSIELQSELEQEEEQEEEQEQEEDLEEYQESDPEPDSSDEEPEVDVGASLKRLGYKTEEIYESNTVYLRKKGKKAEEFFRTDKYLSKNFYPYWVKRSTEVPNLQIRKRQLYRRFFNYKYKFFDDLQSFSQETLQNFAQPTDFDHVQVGRRILKKDITGGQSRHEVPVCLEINAKNFDIPDTFAYRMVSHVSNTLTEYLEEFTKLRESIQVICTCEETLDGNGCWGNPDCPCFKLNDRMKQLQITSPELPPIDFKTYGPCITMDGSLDDFNTQVGFACGDKCSCKGNCGNNVLKMVADPIYEFEVFRRDKKLGFGLRTTNFIPIGSPVLDFVGEIHENKNKTHSLLLHESRMVPLFKIIENNLPEDLLKYYTNDWHICASDSSNVSRFINHGCFPNVASYRIFSEGLAPHQAHLVLFALEDIAPGSEIFLN
ncbi:unnamed protein product [Caenorhabditis auriculariae]|uniref:SET domain-containing protein n=1 Tax=Caenorhabditis auriculariae TaxID=2777116 RepID=A0A8S1GWF6_9PELO|nr:unnamed protein product [Caenorhabditis auriculariae]